MAPAQASLLAKLDTQERVRDFLTNAVASGRASHAYLFLGAPGAGKLDAAWALAQAFLVRAGRLRRMRQLRARLSAYASRRALLHARERHGLSYCPDPRAAR